MGPAVVIDATVESQADEDFLLSVDFLKNWEAEHGQIPKGAWVLYRTDWSKRATPEFTNKANQFLLEHVIGQTDFRTLSSHNTNRVSTSSYAAIKQNMS